jgi:hypothetical protein
MLRDIGRSGFITPGRLSVAIFSKLLNSNAFISFCLKASFSAASRWNSCWIYRWLLVVGYANNLESTILCFALRDSVLSYSILVYRICICWVNAISFDWIDSSLSLSCAFSCVSVDICLFNPTTSLLRPALSANNWSFAVKISRSLLVYPLRVVIYFFISSTASLLLSPLLFLRISSTVFSMYASSYALFWVSLILSCFRRLICSYRDRVFRANSA